MSKSVSISLLLVCLRLVFVMSWLLGLLMALAPGNKSGVSINFGFFVLYLFDLSDSKLAGDPPKDLLD
jgi:hypothetical protein